MYTVSSVDNFLRLCAHNFGDVPPTIDDLRSGRLVLLRASEVEQQFGFSDDNLYRLRRSRKIQLAFLKFPGKYGGVRYSRSGIIRLLQKPDAIYSTREVGRILGRSNNRVFRLIKQGKLESIRNPEDTACTYVSHESLVSLLRAWLPQWVNPEDWLEDCKASTEPLVPLGEAAKRLGLGVDAALKLLKQRRALFITGPYGGGHTVVSPIWLAAYEERAQPLTAV